MPQEPRALERAHYAHGPRSRQGADGRIASMPGFGEAARREGCQLPKNGRNPRIRLPSFAAGRRIPIRNILYFDLRTDYFGKLKSFLMWLLRLLKGPISIDIRTPEPLNWFKYSQTLVLIFRPAGRMSERAK
jgi:hypothetical protein